MPLVDFDDDELTPELENRIEQAQAWIDEVWSPYYLRWREVDQTKRFYRKVFEAAQLLRDSPETYELVWGFGEVIWVAEEFKLRHPTFGLPVEIVRADSQQLSIVPTGPLELEMLPFFGLTVRDRAALTAKRSTLEQDPFDPWSDELVDQCRDVVRSLNDGGVVRDEGAALPTDPIIYPGWVLYVRRRRPDYQGFLDHMRALYSDGAQAPDALKALVIDAPSTLSYDEYQPRGGAASLDPLLLPLPSNEEQQRILHLAQTQTGVVVQGPPGTGKSHTIANLVSHYVAYGQRVLVVAEKEQALRVLAEKIPAGIAELTVPVLGADQDGRAALEAAIRSIQSTVSGIDVQAYDKRIEQLTNELKQIDARIAETTSLLLRSRELETSRLAGRWPCGNDPTPTVAAAWLSANEESFSYIPDPLGSQLEAPVSPADLMEVARLLTELGLDRARETAFLLPDLGGLPTGSTLVGYWSELDQVSDQLALLDPITDWEKFDSCDGPSRESLAATVTNLRKKAEAADEPWLERVAEKLSDPLLAAEWKRFIETIGAERAKAVEMRGNLAARQIQVPAFDPALKAALVEARARLLEKGKLGLFSGKAKEALERCQVDGRAPSTAAEVDLCLGALDLAEIRRALQQRWASQIALVAGPTVDDSVPEEAVSRYLHELDFVLSRRAFWDAFVAESKELGIQFPGTGLTSEAAWACDAVNALQLRPRLLELRKYLDDVASYLSAGVVKESASRHWRSLLDATVDRDPAAWDDARRDITSLLDVTPKAIRLVGLHDALSAAAPIFCQQIVTAPESLPEVSSFHTAWQWRQLQTWVEEILGADSPAVLQSRIEQLSRERLKVVGDLVSKRAWRRLVDNLGDSQRQALTRYVTAIKKYGKTGGKYAAIWLKEIREALNDSKDAVPVWIMSTSRALGSFRPEVDAPFDVIIVDEASQIDVSAVPLLALAKRAIVVGDDKQTSPGSMVGLEHQQIFDLINAHLSDIPNSTTLFAVGSSLYDMANQKFPRSVMLREHFRCLPEIISFSNRMYYHGQIEPLRDQRPLPDWPSLGAIKVLDGFRPSNGVNEPEVNVVVDLICELNEDRRYDGMSFGVVCLMGGGQSDEVSRKLFERLGPADWQERRIRVGDAANFQGDERDVMVVSLVAALDPIDPNGRIGAMTKVADGQRLNVAASRARNQMWVVHSLEPEQFPKDDPRAELIRHARNPMELDLSFSNELEKCESEFEKDVFNRIVARGYRRVRSQVHVGTLNHSYRIDLVVEGPQAKLAVECDGDRWHGPDRWHEDRVRQEILERAGWTFVRIRGSEFYRSPDEAMDPVWGRLNALGIPTGDEWLNTAEESAATRREVRGFPLPDEEVDDEEATLDLVESVVWPDWPTE